MERWRKKLNFDPLPPLLSSENPAILFFTRRDLLSQDTGAPESLWQLPQVQKILNRQQADGAWRYPGGGKQHMRAIEDYNQIETFRVLGELVEKYALNKKHPAIHRAGEYLFTRQTREGDFRGIYGNQYTPNYSGAIMELLIKAGYGADPRIRKAFRWMVSIRQNDGGWTIPLSAAGAKWDARTLGGETIQPDPSTPFSHMTTGMVLRAFAAHPQYRQAKEAIAAGKLLATRLLKKDSYPGRRTVDFWTKYSYPFWFTDLLSALDSLSQLGFVPEDLQVAQALDWFVSRQQASGVWKLYLLRMAKEKDCDLWIQLAVCRVFKRFYA